MLVYDANKRLSAEELLKEEWIIKNSNNRIHDDICEKSIEDEK